MSVVLLVASVLPLAVAAAFSPTVLTIQVLLLTTENGNPRRAWAFAVGRGSALLVVTVAAVTALASLPDFRVGGPSWAEAVIAGVAGALLVGISGYLQHRGPKPAGEPSPVANRIAHAPLPVVGLFAFAWLFVNASTLALYLPALHSITRSTVGVIGQFVAVAALYLITMTLALGPPAAISLFGERARDPLLRLHHWLETHGHAMTRWITLLCGIGLILLAVWNAIRLT